MPLTLCETLPRPTRFLWNTIVPWHLPICPALSHATCYYRVLSHSTHHCLLPRTCVMRCATCNSLLPLAHGPTPLSDCAMPPTSAFFLQFHGLEFWHVTRERASPQFRVRVRVRIRIVGEWHRTVFWDIRQVAQGNFTCTPDNFSCFQEAFEVDPGVIKQAISKKGADNWHKWHNW